MVGNNISTFTKHIAHVHVYINDLPWRNKKINSNFIPTTYDTLFQYLAYNHGSHYDSRSAPIEEDSRDYQLNLDYSYLEDNITIPEEPTRSGAMYLTMTKQDNLNNMLYSAVEQDDDSVTGSDIVEPVKMQDKVVLFLFVVVLSR